MRWVSVVGARPQFVKLAAVCRALANGCAAESVQHLIVHTGQHYDAEMSAAFFRDLAIQAPIENLGVGSGTHGEQTGETIKRLEPQLVALKPDWVLVYGDTNSTLAGAVVASKLAVSRVAHVEAGLRSFNRSMPEEINRIATDHLSDLLLCPTETALMNLRREGLDQRAVLTGDVMFDTFLRVREIAQSACTELTAVWKDREFALATVHRQENTDRRERLFDILAALEEIAATVCPVVLPLHPRTRKNIEGEGWKPRSVTVTPPVSYYEMLLLLSRSRMVLTDSGGVQKEAYFAARPCITLRQETEWVETLGNGCNVLVGTSPEAIVQAARQAGGVGPWERLYGEGRAGQGVVEAIMRAS